MTEFSPYVEAQLANMSDAEYDAFTARIRPPAEETDPKIRAANALRRSRGLDRKLPATKEQAAAAMRELRPPAVTPTP